MARKPAMKPARKAARKAAVAVDEGALTKGQLRKLVALRKSVGEKIGTKAFAEWLAEQQSESGETRDENADLFASLIEPVVKEKNIRIRRGGYLIKRGRGRVIVTPAED